MKFEKKINLNLIPIQHKWIKQTAKTEGISMSKFFRKMVSDFIHSGKGLEI